MKTTSKAIKDREYYQKNHAAVRAQQVDSRLRIRYGISKDDFDRMAVEQSGLCLICERKPTATFHVDHNHDTGHVRGLLCASCNVRLGILEQHDWVEKAHAYLALRDPAYA